MEPSPLLPSLPSLSSLRLLFLAFPPLPSFLPSSSLSFPFLPPPFIPLPSFYPYLPPLCFSFSLPNPFPGGLLPPKSNYGVWRSAVSSPQRVRAELCCQMDFGAFSAENLIIRPTCMVFIRQEVVVWFQAE